jgi:hypothetical protein
MKVRTTDLAAIQQSAELCRLRQGFAARLPPTIPEISRFRNWHGLCVDMGVTYTEQRS